MGSAQSARSPMQVEAPPEWETPAVTPLASNAAQQETLGLCTGACKPFASDAESLAAWLEEADLEESDIDCSSIVQVDTHPSQVIASYETAWREFMASCHGAHLKAEDADYEFAHSEAAAGILSFLSSANLAGTAFVTATGDDGPTDLSVMYDFNVRAEIHATKRNTRALDTGKGPRVATF